MLVTNKYNLPEAIHHAAAHDEYSRGDSKISITTLIDSPRVRLLQEKHKDEIELDVVDRIWSMLGTAMHKILDNASSSNHITEERLYATIEGWKISGAIDIQHLDEGVLTDYKLTSTTSLLYDKKSWHEQLNCYAYLVKVNKNIKIKKLRICAVLRDWKAAEARRDSSYPQQPIVMVDIPVWTWNRQEAFVRERVILHQEAGIADALGEPLPPCTDEERWIRGTKWAVIKDGSKRATKLFATEAAAAEFVAAGTASNATELRVEKRGGGPSRCTGNYCQVANFCDQFRSERQI